MSDAPTPLRHADVDTKDAGVLRGEAREHLAGAPNRQLMAELLLRLRELRLPWWTPEHLRTRFPARARMEWLRERADVRQQITSALSGLAPNAARKKSPEFQGELIDSVIDDGDITATQFEESFTPEELVVYGPVDLMWREFRSQMPWGESTPVHQDLIAWLMEALLRDTCTIASVGTGVRRAPILTPWDVRTAISGLTWHSRMPIEVRVSIDETRLQMEKSSPSEPFHAAHDLAIAMPSVVAANIPLIDLVDVFLLAERALGFATTTTIHVPSADGEESLRALDHAAREGSTEPFATVTATVAAPAGKRAKRTTLMEFPQPPLEGVAPDSDEETSVSADAAPPTAPTPKPERASSRRKSVTVEMVPQSSNAEPAVTTVTTQVTPTVTTAATATTATATNADGDAGA